MIKVLVVDDSAFMRKALTSMLQEDPEIKVIGTARDGVEAIQMIQDLKPDIVTMDVEMPRMDGITALREIMQKCPVPVIMVSSLTTEGAKVTLEALELGAVDFIPKNLAELSVNIVKIKGMLIEKIKTIGKRGIIKRRPIGKPAETKIETPKVEIPKVRVTTERKVGIVSIGTSTGGPKALQEIIPKLPKDFPVPIVIAQHMPPNFTKPFAERLDQLSQLSVKEAEEGEAIKPGIVYVAPGRGHMRLKRRGIETLVTISEDKEEFIYRPSVDALMLSVADCFPGRSLGVILTGMGNDGAKGCKKIKESGGRVFAQNEESCVVYGMPRAVIEAGIADKVVSLEEMAGEIINAV
ncbi:MAG: chemotaxis response regulator protein-glutamate methylesterase [Thermodesulfovibrio sp.]|jgi:two-component system chemotaxis response regulator CheB|uniref:protein-glutamate methylesterase/protein-glutamine glutaminase n=1 Tax=unclassified Thermodesulfovibrio TaxID=2645936 RepID=UPI00083B93BD|nr:MULTISPECIES: chemotaxis response regulator protein-glutamate methylesterase [unclassified Thermodesulfovibrio]MDI1471798.1 chemotaxis response regulator protein-glutamate methylesterase [Thermodesulfovibrio sp. 1176]MDI6713688.1 chemotaxis response regulator protein-glutamate methylesterase [Thermodesulfovibrio sp.]ODA44188.1 Chemotaxis response regulator protein-glutamate methylesterase CheB [Thermodesulfovibrio sp. N1]